MTSPSFFKISASAVVLLLSCAVLCRGQAFPCPDPDSNAPTPPGGYQNVEAINSDQDVDNLLNAINASFIAYVNQDSGNNICNNSALLGDAIFQPLQLCSQVVAGTNFAVKYVAKYSCDVDADTEGQNTVVLNAVVFEPLPSDADPEPEFQVQSVSRDRTFSASQTTIEEPEEAAPAAAPAAAPTDAAGNPTGNLGSFTVPGLRKLML